MQTRRHFLKLTAASVGATVMLPYAAHAATGGSDTFATNNGQIVVHPVSHASFVMEVPELVIYNDPVGDVSAYKKYPAPDLILLTHHHSDHYNPKTLAGLMSEGTKILANPKVYEMLPAKLKAAATSIANGGVTDYGKVNIEAIPAYNYTEDRKKYHPKGRDNGYIVTVDGRRIYIAGDTEDIPEMRALQNIDIAFIPMILPYTMDGTQAASALSAFAPKHAYAYHYKGPEKTKFDALAAKSAKGTKLHDGPWYS